MRPCYIGKRETNNEWCLLDRLVDAKKFPGVHQNHLKKSDDLYMAPEVLDLLANVGPDYSETKSYLLSTGGSISESSLLANCKPEVFSLGMCLLNAGVKKCTQLYKKKNSYHTSSPQKTTSADSLELDTQSLNSMKKEFDSIYMNANRNLCEFVGKCLVVENSRRDDPYVLQKFLRDRGVHIKDPLSLDCPPDQKFVLIQNCTQGE